MTVDAATKGRRRGLRTEPRDRLLNDSGGMNDKIRVFHLIKSLGRGGAEVLLEEGLRVADRERFEYAYGYFLPWKDAVVGNLEAQGAPVICFGGRNNVEILLAARRVAASLRRRRVNVLHCHLAIAGVVGRIAGRLAGIPVVYTEHNKWDRHHPVTRRLNHATWRLQDRVIAVSADVAESIRAYTRAPVPIQVVQNGVDVERFQRTAVEAESARRDLGIPPGAPVVGTVAVFRAQKRLLDWLRAANRVREQVPDAHFVIVGAGPLRSEVVEGIGRLGLSDAVHLVGFQEDVRPFTAAMDVYLMSSAFEGLPVALLEAMSMECAPICTAVGGIPEVIRSGENGFLSPPEEPEALGRLVVDVLQSPEKLRECGAAARRTVQERFSIQSMSAELEALYLSTLERNGTSH